MGSVNYKINDDTKTYINVRCTSCNSTTKHLVLVSVEVNQVEETEENCSWQDSEYQVIMCQGCEETGFRSVRQNSEDWDFSGVNSIEYIKSVNLYPNRNFRAPLKGVYILPENVCRIYEETIQAMANNLPVLSGIGIRAIVETVCKDKISPGKNLYEKIDGLVAQGVLSQEGSIILHAIRTLGNEAAHEVKPHTNNQLELAIDVCEHLLQAVYVLPYQAAKEFKKP
jgi:hypothetical protein